MKTIKQAIKLTAEYQEAFPEAVPGDVVLLMHAILTPDEDSEEPTFEEIEAAIKVRAFLDINKDPYGILRELTS